jgi:DNA polymerase
MKTVHLADGADFDGWRTAARQLLAAGIAPEQVSWGAGTQASLLGGADGRPDGLLLGDGANPVADHPAQAIRIPAELLQLLHSLLCHSDPQRYALAYRLLWRVTHGERQLLCWMTDPDVVRARNAEKNVRRDSHKMKAFVRFREVPRAGAEPAYVSWFEPEHYILERIAPFFARRFTGMDWSILTPYRSAHWDGHTLHYGPGAKKTDAPSEDALETYWRTYYASIFNPARLKVQAMKSEMPVKYWKNLPEAVLIPELIRSAQARTQKMLQSPPSVPRKPTLRPAR